MEGQGWNPGDDSSIAHVLEMDTDFVERLEGLQRGTVSEEAAVVGGDVQTGVAFSDGVRP